MQLNYSLKDLQNGLKRKKRLSKKIASSVPWRGSSWVFHLLKSSLWKLEYSIPFVTGSLVLRRYRTDGSESCFHRRPWGPYPHQASSSSQPVSPEPAESRGRVKTHDVHYGVPRKAELRVPFVVFLTLPLASFPLVTGSPGADPSSPGSNTGTEASAASCLHAFPPSLLLSVAILAEMSGIQRQKRNFPLFWGYELWQRSSAISGNKL